MGQIQWTISLVLIGLFSIAIIGFALNFALDNNAAVKISNDPEISGLYSDSVSGIEGFNDGSSDSYASIINSSIEAEGTTTQSVGQFAITPANVVGVTTNILRVGYRKIFGSGEGFGLFITTFLGLIVFITGLLLWKTWAGRNPD